jgi:hypothetical protein
VFGFFALFGENRDVLGLEKGREVVLVHEVL